MTCKKVEAEALKVAAAVIVSEAGISGIKSCSVNSIVMNTNDWRRRNS